MDAKKSRNVSTCTVLYMVWLRPNMFIVHPPYMVVNYASCASIFRRLYQLVVALMNVLVDPARPMLLVFPATCRCTRRNLNIVSILLVFLCGEPSVFGIAPACHLKECRRCPWQR